MRFDNNWSKEQNRKKNELLASQLGISYELLIQTEWDIIEHKNDYNHLTSITVKFRNTKDEILSQIPNIDMNAEVHISLFVDYDEDFVDYQDRCEVAISSCDSYVVLYSQVFQLRQLNLLFIEDSSMSHIQKSQIFVSGISVLEIFLLDTFLLVLNSNELYFKEFISTYKPYKERKISFNSIYTEYENLRETVKTDLSNIIFHNLGRIKPIFESTFKIKFPSIRKMSEYIKIRHDLVHRNGKQKDNTRIEIDEKIVNELLTEIMRFSNVIIEKLKLHDLKEIEISSR